MRGTMEERRPGVWRLRVVVGYEMDVRPRRATRTIYGTRRVAQSELAKFVTEAESPVIATVATPRVNHLLERWSL